MVNRGYHLRKYCVNPCDDVTSNTALVGISLSRDIILRRTRVRGLRRHVMSDLVNRQISLGAARRQPGTLQFLLKSSDRMRLAWSTVPRSSPLQLYCNMLRLTAINSSRKNTNLTTTTTRLLRHFRRIRTFSRTTGSSILAVRPKAKRNNRGRLKTINIKTDINRTRRP